MINKADTAYIVGVRASRGIGLYIHIPFCQTKCSYCDFNTYAGINSLIPTHVRVLSKEIEMWAEILGHPKVSTIFFGGGTPSLLSPDQLGAIIDTVQRNFASDCVNEITVEVNPDDVTEERMEGFLQVGVTRVSLGIQSLDDSLLKILGRRHDSSTALEAFKCIRSTGFTNISVDLMYGLPMQTLAQWKNTCASIMDLDPNHISAYCMTVEAGTPLASQVAKSLIPEPNSDLAADMIEWVAKYFEGRGYDRYEISNWAQPGFFSQHNLGYWANFEYLGVGPGAHSYLGSHRFSNVRLPRTYLASFDSTQDIGRLKSEDFSVDSLEALGLIEVAEMIPPALEMSETMMLGLRLNQGVRLKEFHARFGVHITEVFSSVIDELENLELIQFSEGETGDPVLRLSPRGQMLGNEVFQRFLFG